ncbi:response regulator transcription factor [Anaeromicropila herbilytica]|uniref:Stage 0 sporulation protein A homolog n=1 Tax=Anaeromicropila herbilytica TaxID=2785025 RepID=A0A7R7EHM4_9FIRM|nr:response regulator transcription factor [Anaeromicropila herbilytica]BCN28914.1 DNA-binding response regulator [Anaeromicropila herbilytica]
MISVIRKNILIIEDDQKLNEGIRLALRSPEYEFLQCRTLEEAWEQLNQKKVDLILLDVNLPDGNGLDFLKKLRTSYSVPVIIITANNMETDIVMGLELGANDYITKPFSLMVLRARVGVQLRNYQGEKNTHYVMDFFDFDFEQMIFKVRGEIIEFSKTEQKLLKLLVDNKGATLTRDKLIDSVWLGDTEYVEEHALTVAIKRLRDKLGENSNQPEYLRTVYGIGYTWIVK